ncbi:MAG: peptide chain release factor N(5)-glutamine methyltransferase [Candidatus Eremiobacteraeota bacterium]|nr:peptide chain release factor N(5)-glutamine methyltransferase [Candidatus Eremiobacteraeota bacterium]
MAAGVLQAATVQDAVRFGWRALAETDGAARARAVLLLAHTLARPREWIVAHPGERLSETQRARFARLCERHRAGEPIAYIIGSAGFYGREFLVNGDVLIPRPETEHLVDEAIAFINGRRDAVRVLDVGTGSGAIACSIAAETSAVVHATDISGEAVALAASNAERLGVTDRCRFLSGDLAMPVKGERYDVVIANLPYVPTAELAAPPDPTSFEPRIALDGGCDGLSVYRELLPSIGDVVSANAVVLFEAAPPTIDRLMRLTQGSLPDFTVSIGSDYAGLARYVKAAKVK